VKVRTNGLCYHEKLEPYGGCRLYTVEAEAPGATKLVYEEFERVYDERYQQQCGPWRPVIGEVLRKYLECEDLRRRPGKSSQQAKSMAAQSFSGTSLDFRSCRSYKDLLCKSP